MRLPAFGQGVAAIEHGKSLGQASLARTTVQRGLLPLAPSLRPRADSDARIRLDDAAAA